MNVETIQKQPDSNLFAELYMQFGADLIQAREFIARECNRPEMRRQFDDLEAEALYLLIRSARPELLVEISPCDGWSTTWILKAIDDNQTGKLQSFDVHDRSRTFVPDSLIDRWQLHVGDVRDPSTELPNEVDFLLIDSKHTYGFAKWYFTEVIPKVKKGAPVVIHDVESGLPIPGSTGVWTGINPFGTEAWKVQRELKKSKIAYYALCNTLKKDGAGFVNSRIAELSRSSIGINEDLQTQTRNPAIFFFKPT